MLYTVQLVRSGISGDQEWSGHDTWLPLGRASSWLLSATTSQASDKGILKFRADVSFDGTRWESALTLSSTFNPGVLETHMTSFRAADLSSRGPLMRIGWWTDGFDVVADIRVTGRARASHGFASGFAPTVYHPNLPRQAVGGCGCHA